MLNVGGCDVSVTFAEANHCPGAVCILFSFDNGKKTLHTGDFRWSRSLLRSSAAVYRPLASTSADNAKNLTVYLDTTYCDPSHDFPLQECAIQATIDAVRHELKVAGTLLVFGAYDVGKERLYMQVAKEFGLQIFVEKPRWKTLMCYDWKPDQKMMLSTDAASCWLWVVGMGQINFNHLDKLKTSKRGATRVVGFLPTGWTHNSATGLPKYGNQTAKGRGTGGNQASSGVAKDTFEDGAEETYGGSGAAAGSSGSYMSNVNSGSSSSSSNNNSRSIVLQTRRNNSNVIYSVPYSEHSSFDELVDFVKIFRYERNDAFMQLRSVYWMPQCNFALLCCYCYTPIL